MTFRIIASEKLLHILKQHEHLSLMKYESAADITAAEYI